MDEWVLIGEKYHDFCINDARWYAKKAAEALDASIDCPEEYYNESLHCATVLKKSLPVLFLNSLSHDVPVVANPGSNTVISVADMRECIIRIISQIYQNFYKLLNFYGFCNNLPQNI